MNSSGMSEESCLLIRRDFFQQRCVNTRRQGQVCEICTNICPVDALGFTDAGPSLSSSCMGCGLCISSCPQTAFGDPFRFTAADSEPYSLCSGLWPEGPVGQSRLPAGFIPCAGSLTLPTLIKLWLEGVPQLRLVCGDCERCSFKQGRALFDSHQATLAELAQSFGLPVPRMEISTAGEPDLARARALYDESLRKRQRDSQISRRDLVFGLRKVFQQARQAEPLGQTPPKTRPQGGPILPGRELIRQRLRDMSPLEISGRESDYLHAITVEEQCHLCGMCARACPSGALSLQKSKDSLSLRVDQVLCTGCGLCQKLCPRSALSVTPGLGLQAAAAGPILGKRLPLITCKVCHKPFVAETAVDTCSACQKNNRVMNDASRLIWGENIDAI